jgi:hypothetical protein
MLTHCQHHHHHHHQQQQQQGLVQAMSLTSNTALLRQN